MRKSATAKSVSGLITVALLAAGCATSTSGEMSGGNGHAAAMSAGAMSTAPTSTTPASTLRTTLNALLGEHLILAAEATGAALDGRGAEFKAASATLDANSVDIARAIGSVYGTEAEEAFLPLWRRHIGFAVDYTVGVATKDTAKQEKSTT